MGSYQNNISLGIKLQPSKEVQTELETVIGQLEKNSSIDLKIDTKQINQSLKEFGDTLNNISNQMKNGFNFGSIFTTQASGVEGVTNKLKEEQKAIEQTANTMRTLSSTSIGKADSDGNITETLKTVEQLQVGIGNTTRLTTDLKTGLSTVSNTENFQKLDTIITNLQNKLSKSSNNKFINESVIIELQNRLDKINTNTAEKEFKELQTTINNLGSSDNQIVRLQSTISKMESSLTSMKSKYGSLVGDSSSKSSLDTYISEIEKLKTLMSSLQNGGTISGSKLASELNQGTEASRNLSNSVKNSSSALKLAQQDANSFGGTLSKVLSNAGIYMGAYQGIQMVTSAVKEGAKYVEYLNASFTDMKMTMDISESAFNKLSSEIDEMGKKIGAVSTDMHDIARVYANANTSADEIMKKVKSASELSNISGMSGVDTTKSIQSVTQQFRLMEQEGANASEVTQHIGDVMTAVSRNMSYDFSDGIVQLTNAVKESGSVAKNAGMDLEQYSAYVGALVQNTGRSGSEISNAFKMISARVLQMKDVSEEMGVSEDEQSKAEKAMTKLGISIRTGGGDLKDLNTILTEVGSKWSGLTDVEKQYTSEMLAGNRQRDVFMSLMSSMPDIQNLYGKALQSTGALEDANTIKAESYQGKLNTLKTTFNQLSATMINSKMLTGGLDVASGTLNGINTLASKLGSFPTLIMAITGALTIFNTKFRENINIIGGVIPGYSKLTNSLTEYRTKLSESAIKQAENISTLKTFEMAYQNGGVSVKGMATQLAGMEAKLIATKLAMVSTTVATVAMETAVSMGLSLVITGIITGLSNLVNAQDNLKKSNEEVISSYKSEKESVTNATKLLEEKQKLEEQLANTNVGTEENKNLKTQLLDVERQLAQALPNSTTQYDEQGKAIATNNKQIEEQIKLKKQAMLDDTLKQLDKNNSGMSSMSWSPKDIIGEGTNMGFGATTLENIDKTIEKYKQLKAEAEKSSNEATTSFGKSNATEDLQRYSKMLDEATSKSSQYKLLIMNAIDAGKSTSDLAERFGVSEDVIKSYGLAVENTTQKQKVNSNQTDENANKTKVLAEANKELNGETGKISDKTLKSLQEAYPKVTMNATDTNGAIKKLTDSTKSAGDSADDASKKFEKLGNQFSSLGNEAKVIDTIKDEMSKYGGVTEDTYATIISKFPDLLKVMSQEGDLTKNLTDYQTELRTQQEKTKDDAIANANGIATAQKQANSDSVTSNADANTTKAENDADYSETAKTNATDTSTVQQQSDIDSANNNAEAVATKSQNDVDYNINAQTNANDTKDSQSQTYEEDKTNQDNANIEKEASNSWFINAINYGLGDWLSSSNNKYISDLGNWINAMQQKVSWFNWFKDSTADNSSTGAEDSAQTMNSNGTPIGLAVDDDTIKKAKEERAKKEADAKKQANEEARKKALANMPKTISGKQASNIDSDAKGAKSAEKKAESEAKKANEEKIKSEKEALAKITGAYDDASKKIESSISEISYQKELLGEPTDDNFSPRLELQNKQLDLQKDKVKEAFQQLMQLENTSYDTEEAQKALADATEKATKELNAQRLEVVKLSSEIQKLEVEQIKKVVEQEKEVAGLELEGKHKAQTKALEEYTQTFEDAHETTMQGIEDETKALEKKHDEEQKSIDLQEKKNSLKKAEIDLERQKNNKTIKTFELQSDGSYQSSYRADKKEIEKAQEKVDEENKAIKKIESDKKFEEDKKKIEKKKEEEEQAYKKGKKLLDKTKEDLKEAQTQEKERLDYHYKDLNKLSKDRLAELNQQYGDNWKEINKIIDKNLTNIKTKFDRLSEIKVNFGLEGVDEATKSKDLDKYIIDRKSQLDKVVKLDLGSLKLQVENLKEKHDEIDKENDTHHETTLTKQNTSQENQYNSTKDFAKGYLLLYDKFLETVQIDTDFRFSNIVAIIQGANKLILDSLVNTEKDYEKFAEMWNKMHPNNKIASSVDISDNIANLENYKKSVLDWTNSKLELYKPEQFDKYIGEVGNQMGNAIIGRLNGMTYSANGTTNSNNISNINNKNSSSITYVNNNFDNVSLPNVRGEAKSVLKEFVQGVGELGYLKK